MQKKNLMLELFEPPMSIGDITLAAVAFLEHEWKDHNLRILYFALRLVYSKTIQAYSMRRNTWQSHGIPRHAWPKAGEDDVPGWWGLIWVGVTKPQDPDMKGMVLTPKHALNRIGIQAGTGGSAVHERDLPHAIAQNTLPNVELNTYCDSWSYDVTLLLDSFPSMKMLKMLKPDSPQYRGAFTDDTIWSYYTNFPWSPNVIPRPKYRPKWLEPEMNIQPLQFLQ